MLKVHNINKSVHGKQILHSISFSVPRRSVAVFLGGSGAGKTTLLRVLNNLEPFDSGVIELDGKTIDLQRVGSEHVVGMVFQHFNLFEHLSVRRNITLPLVQQKYTEQEACCIADSLLKKYGLFEKAN